jgi:hypothetical protein
MVRADAVTAALRTLAPAVQAESGKVGAQQDQ